MIKPYLNFNGNTREAIDFYEKVFDGQEKAVMTFQGMPDIPSEMKDWVLHGRLVVAGSELLFSDAMSTDPVSFGTNMTLMIETDCEDELRSWFRQLSEKGEVWQELQSTFFSPLYGSLKDGYGIVWQFNLQTKKS